MVLVTTDDVAKLAPDMRAAYRQAILSGQPTLDSAGVSATPLRVAHFFAQIMQECGALTLFQENLNYSAEGLVKTWPGRFPSLADAQPYAHNPEKIGDKVYGGRMGNDQPGDGYAFRGRGMLQTTGKTAYHDLGVAIGHDLLAAPDDAFSADWSLTLACAVWTAAHGNTPADADDVKGVTRAINGGLNGLAGRTEWLRKAKAVWGA